jgi:flavodoxin
MNTLIVYFSKFGHTQQIALAMAQALETAHGMVRLISAEELVATDLAAAALVVMGSPTHNMNVPTAVRPVLESLPKGCLRGKQVAAFDTSYKMNWLLARFTAAPRLNRQLRKLGGKPVTRPETFFVAGREGPLFDGELERARLWATALVAQTKREIQYHVAYKEV